MLSELVQLATVGTTQAHLVLLVMRTLIEEVYAEEDGGGGANGGASASTDPRSALTASAADMLEWLHLL